MNDSLESVAYSEDRYPKRNRKTKIEDLSSLEEPEYKYMLEKPTQLTYDINEILTSPEYEYDDVVKCIPVEEFTLDYIKKTGLTSPLFFNVHPDQLGMNMPDPDKFTVDDVLESVGRNRKIEVVEVCTQNGRLMNLSEFVQYYKKPVAEREELLNVLSLEFSSTKLADLVSAPSFVPKIDWIDNVWPKELFKRQENLLRKSSWARDQDFSTYPKVQRYCLMSVANCFTDYHVDFGGTSVWYHILKGEKVFWLIEPSEENLKLYEEWILGGSNNSCFFGKIVTKCTRLFLKQGSTLIIPSGWIHCVYTPIDSLVFGGNFLHSFSVPMQIRVSRSEDRIKIGSKYRFPHFKQIFWCYLAKVVKLATGRIYHKAPTEEACTVKYVEEKNDKDEHANSSGNIIDENMIFYDNIGNAEDGSFTFNPIQLKFGDQSDEFEPSIHYDIDYLLSLSPFEINGLHSLFIFMKKLLNSKQPEVIEGITRPVYLIMELKALLNQINKLDRLHLRKDIDIFQKKSKINGHVMITIDNKNLSNEQMMFNLHMPQRIKVRRNTAKNYKVKQDANHPVLVDGLPLPTLASADDSSGNGYNPLEQVVRLGHKPIASAWRRSSDMVRSLPSTSISNLKRKSSDYDQATKLENESATDSNLTDFSDGSTMAQSLQESKNISDVKPSSSRKIKTKFNIPRAAKLIEVHDDSPEFMHRSPLQLFSATQTNTNSVNNVKPVEVTHNQQTFAPRKTFYNRQRFEYGPRWNTSNNDNGFGFHSQNSSRFYLHGTRQNERFQAEQRRHTYEQPTRMDNSNWNSTTETSVLERTNSPERSDYFEKRKDIRIEPQPTQQVVEEAQPIDTAVNELHQISQIMNFPCGSYPYPTMDYFSIEHIPLPPSPKSDLNVAFDGTGVPTTNNPSDPFTEVDQLAQLGQMMHE